MLDEVIKSASRAGETFTVAAVAEDLDVEAGAVKDQVNLLIKTGAATVDSEDAKGNTLRLVTVKQGVRDIVVRETIRNLGTPSRDELDSHLTDIGTGLTSAQTYSSLQRLLLRGEIDKVRDGTRTPRYAIV